MNIQDSGKRREFASGAVRDIADGKGRCDLLPLGVIAYYTKNDREVSDIFSYIDSYVRSGDTQHLCEAIGIFTEAVGWDFTTAMLEVSKHYEDGAKKYAERNWERGISLHCYIDSGVRHLLKFLRRDKDERHDRAFLWNMLCAIWTHINKPELIDLPFAAEELHEGNTYPSDT